MDGAYGWRTHEFDQACIELLALPRLPGREPGGCPHDWQVLGHHFHSFGDRRWHEYRRCGRCNLSDHRPVTVFGAA